MPQNAKGTRLHFKKRYDGSPSTYVIIDGKKTIGTGCTRDKFAEAQEKFQAYVATNFRPNTKQRDLAQIGVAEVMNLYATDIAPGKPSAATIGYRTAALVKFWGDKSLNDVKGSTCRAYVKFRTAQKVKTKEGDEQRFVKAFTARQELKVLSAAINHWHRESPLAFVPKVTLPEATSKRERVLERNEVAAMLRACRKMKFNHVARFILIGIYTGTRHDAIVKLGWTNSLSSGHADVNRGVIYRRGSAERETSKRRPPVSVEARLLSHLKRWNGIDLQLGNNAIINHKGQAIQKMKRAWATVVRESGLGSDVTPHVLRHTCASWLLWEGKTIWDVAGVIGADASTVERVYAHHRKIEQGERKRA